MRPKFAGWVSVAAGISWLLLAIRSYVRQSDLLLLQLVAGILFLAGGLIRLRRAYLNPEQKSDDHPPSIR